MTVLNKLSNLQQRIVAGVIGGVFIIGSIYFGPWSYFFTFFGICLLTQLEFYKLVGLDGWLPLKFFGTVTGLLLFTLTFLVEKEILPSSSYFALFPVFSFSFLIALYRKNHKKPFTNIAYTMLGVIYVALPFALLNLSIFRSGAYTYQVVLGTLLLLWSSDSGAYFLGRKYGKTKLFERVSPKKSWEGSVGGAGAATITAVILCFYFNDLSDYAWAWIAFITVVAGTYGDLVESLFKRSIEIKDSGSFIPGHGGFLDRFDGLLLSAPFIAAFLRIFCV